MESGPISTANYIRNRCPTRSLKSPTTPLEEFFGRKPSISHLRVWGCKVAVHIPPERRVGAKLSPKAWVGIFLGYAPSQKGWRIYNPLTRLVEVRRDVKFYESEFLPADPNNGQPGKQTIFSVEGDVVVIQRPTTSPANQLLLPPLTSSTPT